MYKGAPKLCAQVTPTSTFPTFERCDHEGAAEDEGAEGGEDWSLECLQRPHSGDKAHHLSPLPWAETSDSSQTGVCKSRPLSMTDFGDSLIECEQVEQDFQKLLMELTETDEELRLTQQHAGEKMLPTQPTTVLPSYPLNLMTESTQAKQMAPKHMDEVSCRLYKVLYGGNVETVDSDSEDVSLLPTAYSPDYTKQEVRNNEVHAGDRQTKADKDISEFVVQSDVHHTPYTGSLDVKFTSSMNETQNTNQTGHLDDEDNFENMLSLGQNVPENENKPATPMELVSEYVGNWVIISLSGTEERPLSPESLTEYRPMSPDSAMLDIRSYSPESVTLNEDLSIDSPIPQYVSCVNHPVTIHYHSSSSSSSESMLSDTEYEAMPLLFEKRTVSPDSLGSVSDNEQLLVIQTAVSVEEGNVEMPETAAYESADVENEFLVFSPRQDKSSSLTQHSIPVCGLAFDADHCKLMSQICDPQYVGVANCHSYRTRPQSSLADSEDPVEDKAADLPSDFCNMCLSRHSETKCRPVAPEVVLLEDMFRSDSSHSLRIFQASSVTATMERSSSPDSLCSDLEYGSVFLESLFSENRASSPDSVDDYKPHSPESPIPEFKLALSEGYVTATMERSSSPDSLCSDLEYGSVSLEQLFSENRASSPNSVDEDMALTSESPIPEFKVALSEGYVTATMERSSSPDSLCSDLEYGSVSLESLFSENRASSPDSVDEDMALTSESPIPEFKVALSEGYVTATMERSSSPDSLCSDLEYGSVSLESLFSENRASSPDSVDGDRPHSPESPIPEFKVALSEGYVTATMERSSSPDSLCSDLEYGSVSLESLFSENRASSPNSVDEDMALTSESPIPEFKVALSEGYVTATMERSSSPDSLCSDLEYGSVSLESLFSENRASSPDSVDEDMALTSESPIPEFKVALSEGYVTATMERSSSPDSLCSDLEYGSVSLESLFSENRASSPDSVDGDRPHSPESPIPEFKVALPEGYVTATMERSSSPDSLCSDLEYGSVSLESLFSENRASSPDSVDDDRPHSPESPIPEFKVALSEGYVTATMERSSSPDSLCSDLEYGSVSLESLFSENRASSPDSVDDDRPHSPESPIPEFKVALSEGYVTATMERSSSPDSLCSDLEYGSVSLESLFSENRASSPDSVDEDMALTSESPIPEFKVALSEGYVTATMERSSSPDSLCSDLEYGSVSLESLFSENRASSPDSVDEDMALTSESPIPEFKVALSEGYVTATMERSSSPDSLCSDLEYGSVSLESLFSENRASSPDSVDGDRPHSPESPIPEFKVALPEGSVTATMERSSSPDSLCSDLEYGSVSLESLFSENRASSPDSVDDDRPHSPESPIPEFKVALSEGYVTATMERSSSPDSLCSDLEYGSVSLESLFSENRASSPDSVDEDMALTSESPIPEFKVALSEGYVTATMERSSSPDSLCSDLEYGSVSLESLFSENRASSPDSVDEDMALTSESPIPEFKVALSEGYVTATMERSSSPDSLCSDLEYGSVSLESLFSENRASSPDSVDEDMALTSESPIPEFKLALSEGYVTATMERSSSPDSLCSDLEYGSVSLESLFSENRASSPDSVDGDRPHSPESPIPEFKVALPEGYVTATMERSSSPDSLCSDLEYGSDSLEPLFSENRASSPDSVDEDMPLCAITATPGKPLSPVLLSSRNEYSALSFCSAVRPSSLYSEISGEDSGYFPMPTFETGLTESISISDHKLLLSKSLLQQSSVDITCTEQTPKSPESGITEFTETAGSGKSLKKVKVPIDKLVYGAEFWKLSSQIHDHHYVGETSKTGFFEYAGTKTEYVLEDSEDRPLSPDSKSENRSLLLEEITDSPDSLKGMCSDSPVPPIFPYFSNISECHSSLPESAVSTDGLDHNKRRPLSHVSVISADGSVPFLPDSPLQDLRPVVPELHTAAFGYRSSKPESLLSHTDYGFSTSVVFTNERTDSPQSASNLEDKMSAADETFRAHQMICQLYDPHYVGESFVNRAEIVDDTGTNVECIQLDSDVEEKEFSALFFEPSVSSEFSPAESCILGSPGSFNSETELQPLSPESVMEYRPMSPEDLVTEIRRWSPDSRASINEFRPLSPDSPLPPPFNPDIEEGVLVFGSRSSSPTFFMLDNDLEVLDMQFFEVKGGSLTPDSENEFRTLSPDSPIPEFKHFIFQPPSVSNAECRSSSTESVCFSDLEFEEGRFLSMTDERRLPSPDSGVSRDESQTQSPDSSEPQVMSGVAERYPSFVEFRSTVMSDVKYSSLANRLLDTEDRPVVVESLESETEEKPLTFDSISEYRISSPVSLMANVTSSSPESSGSLNKSGHLPNSTLSCVDASGHRLSSPESVTSEIEYAPLISQMSDVKDRPESDVSDLRCLSPDSPLPQYTTMLEVKHWPLSPISVYSDEDSERDLCATGLFKDRAESSESAASEFKLLLDSPIPEFRPDLESSISYTDFRSCSPQSVLSDFETELYSLTVPEGQHSSPESLPSVSKYTSLSPDSPVPDFRRGLPETNVEFKAHGSSSLESVASETEYAPLILQMFEDRAESPDSTQSEDHCKPLSPASPIQLPRESHSALRSMSPESVLSDLKIDLPTLGKPLSPESLSSDKLSPDSPVPDFVKTLFRVPKNVFVQRSASHESTCSDDEYIFISLSSLVHDMRCSSPGSVASGDEYQVQSPDSPIPDYTPGMPEHVIVNVGYRSSSPESIESDVEYAVRDFLMSTIFCVENRPDSPESVESETEERPLSVESIPEYRPMSPGTLVLLGNIRSASPESTQSFDEHKKLSPDSPLPWFAQNVFEAPAAGTLYGSSSSESLSSLFSDLDCDLTYSPFNARVTTKRALSAQSERSYDELLGSESPVPDFTKSFVETFTCVRNMSPLDFSDSDSLSQASAPFCTGERTTSPESLVLDMEEILASRSSLNESKDPPDPKESLIMVTEYNLADDAERWSPSSQASHLQCARETLHSKKRFTQFVDSTMDYERSETDDENRTEKDKNSEEAESLPPMTEHIFSSRALPYRQGKSIFELPEAETQDEGSPESSMSPNAVMVLDARAPSPGPVTSVSQFRPLSPDSPVPEFTVALSECVMFPRSSSSPLALGSDHMPLNLDFDFVECRPSSVEVPLFDDQNETDRPLSSESSEYIPVSFESAVHMADKRASSPESMPEFNENRPLSPDSPIPQFTESLEAYSTICESSSTESQSSDSEYELIVKSSKVAGSDRPSSPESVSSLGEFEQLLPDSPVPEFMRILSSYFMNATPVDRSSSPVSFASDSEFVALPVDCWINDISRPLSPETAESEEELDSGPSSSLLIKSPIAMSPLVIQIGDKSGEEHPKWQEMKELQPEFQSYKEWMEPGSQVGSFSTLQTTVCEEDSHVNDGEGKQKKTQPVSVDDLKTKLASQRAPETPKETRFQTDDDTQLQSATTITQQSSNIGVLFGEDKLMASVPLQLPEHSTYTTHRAVTPILPSREKVSFASHRCSEWELSLKEAQSSEHFSPSPTPDRDYQAMLPEHLRAPDCSQVSLNDRSLLLSVFSDSMSAKLESQALTKKESETLGDTEDFSPDFKKVLTGTREKQASESELGKPNVPVKQHFKGSESPQHSDSDMEFFDCRQAFSDFSEPEDVITYHISEPPSPVPGSSLDTGLQRATQANQLFLRAEDRNLFSTSSESLPEFAYDVEAYQTDSGLPVLEELPSRDQAEYYDDDDFLGREIAEELGMLSSDSSEEDVLTTRVVRRRVIIQADNLPDIPLQTLTEEKYIDEDGNMVVKKVTRKVIRKYVSPDGMETQEVTIEGSHQESVQIEEGDAVSKVVKRTVLHSGGDQKELTFSESPALSAATASEFEVEPVQGRKVSKVVKTTVVRGERMEKHTGDPSLAADLPSAREDFEKAMSYAGGFGKVLMPHIVEKEIVQDDGSVVKRSQMRNSRSQKRTVVRDAQGKHVHLERLDNTADALQPDALQQHLHRLLQRYCEDTEDEEEDENLS
ncbi:ankyrin-2b isoform X5 [Astatotilapia calliptera]|uniref:ankyrin-2b isoform X5 n=1 Tax=Astatotilapia calliptera TaxID=8154 RepID=UPI000E406E1F|nr:ankyrin-2 isoform X5 [Astatotilapia calliptera]